MFTGNFQTQIPKKSTLFRSHKLFPSKNNNKKITYYTTNFWANLKFKKGSKYWQLWPDPLATALSPPFCAPAHLVIPLHFPSGFLCLSCLLTHLSLHSSINNFVPAILGTASALHLPLRALLDIYTSIVLRTFKSAPSQAKMFNLQILDVITTYIKYFFKIHLPKGNFFFNQSNFSWDFHLLLKDFYQSEPI